MKNTSEFITIIRPSFMKFCDDACRAATLNHLLFRIAGKSKDQPKEKIQAGDILWYATTEQITEEMSKAWGVCKVRSQVNALIEMGIIGRRSNPTWGVDRTKHFCFGTEQCEKLLALCHEHNICVVHLGLCPEVMHLIYSSNANDTSIKCSCEKQGANDESITCIRYNHPMHSIDSSRAFDESIEAIPIDIHKDIHKEEESKDTETQPEPIATSHEVAAHTLFSQEADTQASLIAEAKSDGLQEESEKQEEKPASKSSSSQGKRRPPAKPVDETLKVRVERVYGYFDALAQETSGDATYRYQRTKKATNAITEWLKGTPTEELLREVYLELWNTPADIRSGFDWKRNMHIHSVLAQYDSRSLAIKAKRHAAQPKPATVSPRPARHVEDDDEPLQYRPPLSQRNKNNRPFQAIAAARRA